jgi:hypothetical protein
MTINPTLENLAHRWLERQRTYGLIRHEADSDARAFFAGAVAALLPATLSFEQRQEAEALSVWVDGVLNVESARAVRAYVGVLTETDRAA